MLEDKIKYDRKIFKWIMKQMKNRIYCYIMTLKNYIINIKIFSTQKKIVRFIETYDIFEDCKDLYICIDQNYFIPGIEIEYGKFLEIMDYILSWVFVDIGKEIVQENMKKWVTSDLNISDEVRDKYETFDTFEYKHKVYKCKIIANITYNEKIVNYLELDNKLKYKDSIKN